MKKKLFVLLVVILILSTVAIAASAKPDKKADGVWCYTPNPNFGTWKPIQFYDADGPEPADVFQVEDLSEPGRYMLTLPYTGEWTGAISGESREFGVAVFHGDTPKVFLDAVTIDKAKVLGKRGSLYMDAYGELLEDGTWEGNWFITGGTHKLSDIQGHGTFWGPGWQGDFAQCGIIYYAIDELNLD